MWAWPEKIFGALCAPTIFYKPVAPPFINPGSATAQWIQNWSIPPTEVSILVFPSEVSILPSEVSIPPVESVYSPVKSVYSPCTYWWGCHEDVAVVHSSLVFSDVGKHSLVLNVLWQQWQMMELLKECTDHECLLRTSSLTYTSNIVQPQ